MLFQPALAQDKYPSRPVRMVLPVGPGSASDTFARLIGESMRAQLKGEFVVEHKPGASGMIGVAYVARASPDGYTIGMLHSSPLTTVVATTPSITYNPLKDLTMIGKGVSNPLVIAVASNSRFRTLNDLITEARKRSVTTGIIGAGGNSHFNLETLKLASNADITPVPYSVGTSGVVIGLLGGEIDSAALVWAGLSGQVRDGKIRILATTSPLKEHPDVPTFASLGYPRVNQEVFFGMYAPPGLPAKINEALVVAFKRAVLDPKNAETMEKMGFRISYEAPEQLAQSLADELSVATEVARKVGLAK
jgi:tripartite-type tricarboxylate transporter receptor subunit TctC